jgi:nitrogen fixation NifU-like protein
MAEADVVGRATNPANAATVNLFLNVVDDRIVRAMFQSDGCTATIAASSMLTVMLTGCALRDARLFCTDDVEAALEGLPAGRQHASLLVVDALRSALKSLSPQTAG